MGQLKLLVPMEHDDLVVIVLALQRGVSELEDVADPLRIRLTAMLQHVHEGLYHSFVEQGQVEPLDGDEWRKPG